MAHEHVIVGSGIAGLTAAETIRKHSPGARITLVSDEPHDFYSRPGIAYYLRGDFSEKQLYIRTPEDLRALGLQRVTGLVDKVLTDERELLLSDGRRMRYDTVLLATGALAANPPFPGSDLAGIVKLDGLDDTRNILKLARKCKAGVVVGGGITAMEIAEGFKACGLRTHYFLRGTRYWADVLDETESNIIIGRLKHEGIDVRLQTQIKQAFGENGKVTGVETAAGEKFACQMIGVAIGVRPRIEFAVRSGLATNKGILVNEHLEASAPGVYAAGDAAEVRDPRTGKATLDVLWPIAILHGKAAGANMAGMRQPYLKGVAFNVTMLAGLKTAIIGAIGGGTNPDQVAISRGESESWRIVPKGWVLTDRDDVNRVRLVLGDRTILGALIMGDQRWVRPIQRLIVDQIDITPIRAEVTSGQEGVLPKLAAFFEAEQARKLSRAPSGSAT